MIAAKHNRKTPLAGIKRLANPRAARLSVKRLVALALALAALSTGRPAAMNAAEESTPPTRKGTLIVIGGGSERGAGILERFINRAGGLEARFVIIPTANGSRSRDGSLKAYLPDEVLAVWKTRGLKHVSMLHTADREAAETEEFAKPLREADAIWLDGDNAQDLMDSYLGTLAHREFIHLLARGGVIAGNSAGAVCMGSYLTRGSPPGGALKTGFDFLPDTVFDLQVNTRDRWEDLVPVVQQHPGLLGLGLSEGTALVVSGDRFEVVGKWKVAVHDGARPHPVWERPYVLLSPGDVFNLKTRRIEKLGDGTQLPPPLNPAAPAAAPGTRTASEPAAGTPARDFTSGDDRSYGPEKGALVIDGGGPISGVVIETFIKLAGGPEAKFVVVPTANGNRGADGQVIVYKEEEVLGSWKKRLRLKNVRMLHTHDPKVADTEEFVQPLREANGVWFEGGRQWNLVDSYAHTLAEKEFGKVLERGGVIGGSSAGATIQGDYLVRGAVAGPEIVMPPEPEHQRGFGFLRHSAIDQHINTRNRWDDLEPVVQKYPDLLGIGISESTAIVVTQDCFEVIGKWRVAIHDNTRLHQPWEKPYFVLESGDIFNMRTRVVEKYGHEPQPVPMRK